jgi:hypothetical protein
VVNVRAWLVVADPCLAGRITAICVTTINHSTTVTRWNHFCGRGSILTAVGWQCPPHVTDVSACPTPASGKWQVARPNHSLHGMCSSTDLVLDSFVGGHAAWTLALVVAVAVGVWALRQQLDRVHQAQSVVTTELLSAALSHEAGRRIAVQRVEFESAALCGSGASTCDRLRLKIVYSGEPGQFESAAVGSEALARRSSAARPSSSAVVESSSTCVLKLLLLPWWMRVGATEKAMMLTGSLASAAEACGLGTALFAIINAYSRNVPHAPDAMYRNEVLFYRSVRRSLPANVEMPHVLGTIVDTNRCMHGVCECALPHSTPFTLALALWSQHAMFTFTAGT